MWTEILTAGWPKAEIEKRGNRTMAYEKGKLVADLVAFPSARWAFFHYGYKGGRANLVNPLAAVNSFWDQIERRGWAGTIKGGNPILEDKPEPMGMRDFSLPSPDQLNKLRNFVIRTMKERYPDAKIEDVVLYAGMAWWVSTKGKDGLGVRDIDVNIFFQTGGPRNLRFNLRFPYLWNGTKRTLDVFWNVLKPGQTSREYILEKIRTAKAGRWLTIPERPIISLVTGETIWKGRC